MRLRGRRALVTAVVVGLLATVVVSTAGAALGVRSDLRRASDLVEAATAALTEGRLGEANASLEQAEDLLLSANESLRTSIAVAMVDRIPVVQQNVRAVRESIELAAVVVHGGRRILDEAAPMRSEQGTLEVSLSDGSIPLEAVTAVQREISHLLAQLTITDVADSALLLPTVDEARSIVLAEAAERQRQLEVLGDGLALLRELTGGDGPRRYLVAVANTAEMRGSGGMILNYGVLEGRDGTVDLAAFGDIDELALMAPVSEDTVPADYLTRWTGFEPLRRWRQANLAGDFTVVAPVLQAMYTEATDLPVDGVIQIDPSGLAAILEGVGPVTVPELGEVNSTNVVQLTLNEAYIRFPDVEQRTDVLGDVAEAAFRKLVDGDVASLRTLARRLAEAVSARHLLVQATGERTQDDIVALGADGAYPPLEGSDAIALTVQNLSGNKLDYYLDTSLDLTGDRPAGEFGSVTAGVTLANTAPAGVTTPRYIFGPSTSTSPTGVGVIRSLVTLYLPLGATVEDVGGDATVEPVSSGVEAGRPYAAFIVDVPAGQARSVGLDLRLAPRPEGRYELVAVAAPRVRATMLEVDVATEAGAVRGTVPLDRSWSLGPGRAPEPLRAPVYR